jgi:hypothetical protein
MSKDFIYPEDFFKFDNPTAPQVEIQFKKKVTDDGNFSNSDAWESITFNPSSFFENLSIEDKGGGQKLELSLLDQNFSYLENIIIKSMTAVRMSNKLSQSASGTQSSTDADHFNFYIKKESSVNLRIRFGYAVGTKEGYIKPISKEDSTWKERAKTSTPVAKTPWMYFMTTKCDMKYTDRGLAVNISGLSVQESFLNKVKLVKVFAKYFGHPKHILQNIEQKINKAATQLGEEYSFEFLDEPEAYMNEEGKEEITIMLGSEHNIPKVNKATGKYESQRDYKTIKTLLNEICDLVKPKIFDKNGKKIELKSKPEEDSEALKNMSRIAKYTYRVLETEVEESGQTKIKNIIQFYYNDIQQAYEKQDKVRVYTWGQKLNSIVKNLDVETKTDFAVMNMKIVNVSRGQDGKQLTLQGASVGSGINENSEDEDVMDATVTDIQELNSVLNSNEFESMLVSDVYNSEVAGHSASGAASIMTRNLIYNINQQVFNGTITIPGDPYYLFDGDMMNPMTYVIRIVVTRPSYYDKDGNRVAGKKSYITGNYYIKTIKHNISTSGFETSLEVIKWPSKDN